MTTLVFRSQTWDDCEQPPVQGSSDSALMCSLAHTLQQNNNLTFVIEVHFNNAAISRFPFYHFPWVLFDCKNFRHNYYPKYIPSSKIIMSLVQVQHFKRFFLMYIYEKLINRNISTHIVSCRNQRLSIDRSSQCSLCNCLRHVSGCRLIPSDRPPLANP